MKVINRHATLDEIREIKESKTVELQNHKIRIQNDLTLLTKCVIKGNDLATACQQQREAHVHHDRDILESRNT